MSLTLASLFPLPKFVSLTFNPFLLRLLFCWLAGSSSQLGGHEVIVQAVHSSFPICAMCSLLLTQGEIDVIDAKRRAFLWTGEKTCSGGHCKAPWDLVCIPNDKGGLDIKDLHIQNHCLQIWLLPLAVVVSNQVWLKGPQCLPSKRYPYMECYPSRPPKFP